MPAWASSQAPRGHRRAPGGHRSGHGPRLSQAWASRLTHLRSREDTRKRAKLTKKIKTGLRAEGRPSLRCPHPGTCRPGLSHWHGRSCEQSWPKPPSPGKPRRVNSRPRTPGCQRGQRGRHRGGSLRAALAGDRPQGLGQGLRASLVAAGGICARQVCFCRSSSQSPWAQGFAVEEAQPQRPWHGGASESARAGGPGGQEPPHRPG